MIAKREDYVVLVPNVIALLGEGIGKVAAIKRIAQEHEVSLSTLMTICYNDTRFREFVHMSNGKKSATISNKKAREKTTKNPLSGYPVDSASFMSEFFRYLGVIQERADEVSYLKEENLQLRLTIGKREEESEVIKGLKMRVCELEQQCARLKEQISNVKNDHYAGVMAKAVQQIMDGRPS